MKDNNMDIGITGDIYPNNNTVTADVVHKKEAADRNSGMKFSTGILLAAAAIFGVVFTALLYDNFASLMTFVVMCCVAGFGIFVLKKQEQTIKPGFMFAVVCALLMGLNVGISDDGALAFFDYSGIMIIMLTGLVHQLNDDGKWTFSNYFKSGLLLFGRCFLHLADPVSDLISVKEEEADKGGKIKYVIIGLIIGLPIILIVVGLLASADAVFGELTKDILETVFSPDLFGIIFMALFGLFVSYAVSKAVCCHPKKTEEVKGGSFEPTVAVTIGVVLGLIYLIFSVIQIAYVFIGNMELPEGYTYSEYVHQGFEQLVGVCIINLLLVFMGRGLFRRSRVLNVVLTVISGCTLIMVASCAVRIRMYIDVYHMTVLRLLVIWALVIITIVMAGAIVYIYNDRFPLFRFCVAVSALWFISLGFSRPEYCVASYNLEKARTCDNVDYHYICSLGRDAAPAIYDAVINHSSEIISFSRAEAGGNSLEAWADRYFRNSPDTEYEEAGISGIRNYNVAFCRYMELAEEYRSRFKAYDAP